LEGNGAAGFVGVGFRGGEAQFVEDGLHELHVIDLGHVLQDHGLIGQAGGGHQGHGFVFIPLRFDLPVDRATPLDKETAIGGGGHPWKLPWRAVLINPERINGLSYIPRKVGRWVCECEGEKVERSKRVRGAGGRVVISTVYESADARLSGGACALPGGTRGRF